MDASSMNVPQEVDQFVQQPAAPIGEPESESIAPPFHQLLQLPLKRLDEETCAIIQAEYPLLTDLNLESNELTSGSITSLLSAYLPALRTINLSFNRLSDVPELGSLNELVELDLRGNRISHIAHLSCHPRLTSLDLSQNQIQDLSSICTELIIECPNLYSLQLAHNPIGLQYRPALISLLPQLQALDSVPISVEEKAYIQLLAVTLNSGREGEEQAAPISLQPNIAHSSSQSHPIQRPPSDDSLDVSFSDDSSLLAMSPSHSAPHSDGPSPESHSIPPGSPPRSRLAGLSYVNQMKLPLTNGAHIPAIELQPSQDDLPAGMTVSKPYVDNGHDDENAVRPWKEEKQLEEEQPHSESPPLPADQAAQPPPLPPSHERDSSGSNYSSAFASASPSPAPPAVMEPPAVNQQPPVLALQPPPPSFPSSQPAPIDPVLATVVSDTRPIEQQQMSYAYHPPPQSSSQVYAAPIGSMSCSLPYQPPQPNSIASSQPHSQPIPSSAHQSISAPIASSSAAIASTLTSQAQLVERLQQELQEAKEAVARERAHVRTVKAYYQPSVEATANVQSSSSNSPVNAMNGHRLSSSVGSYALPQFPRPNPAADAAPSAGMLESYRVEIVHLKKQNELLQIQNETNTELLRMKDVQTDELRTKIVRGRPDIDPDLSPLWREKVFTLLVQNKSLIRTHASDIQDYKKQLMTKDQTNQQLEQQLQLLTKTNSSLQTQLQLIQNDQTHRAQLQQQTHALQSQVHQEKQQVQRDIQNIEYLLNVFHEQTTQMEVKQQKRLENKLNEFNKRLAYASERVAVIKALKSKRKVAALGDEEEEKRPISLIQLPTPKHTPSYHSSENDEDDVDSHTRHLKKEIERLQADRSLIYSSWQTEVASLRSQLLTATSRLTATESSLQSLTNESNLVKVELDYVANQNKELKRECADKFSKQQLDELKQEYEKRVEELKVELSSVSQQFLALKLAHDQTSKASMKLQLELQQTTYALNQAKTEANDKFTAKYEYLEEKLKRKEAACEELQQEKRKMQAQIREMENQIILLKHGVGQMAQPPQAQAAMNVPTTSFHSLVRPPAATNSFSNLLFGGGGSTSSGSGPILALPTSTTSASAPSFTSFPLSQPSFIIPPSALAPPSTFLLNQRPQPIQSSLSSTNGSLSPSKQQYQQISTTSAQPTVDPSSFRPATASNTSVSAPSFQVPTFPSGSGSRPHSRPASVTNSPTRARPTTDLPPTTAVPSTHPNPNNIPLLQFPPSSQSSQVNSPARTQSTTTESQPSSISRRKLSHLAALSARLLDDEAD